MGKAFSLAMAFLVSVLALGAGRADAALILYAQAAGVNGGAITQIGAGADFTEASFTGTYGDFTLTILGAASTNDPTLSNLLSAAVSLKNNSATTSTISLYASQDNYSLPVGTPLVVESGLGGTVNIGDLSGSGVFQAYADAGNALLGLADFTNGPQDVVFDGSTFDTGSATGLFDRVGLYSLTSQVTATVSGGGEGNFSSHVNVTAVPEASTFAMAAIGGVCLLGWYGLRRKVEGETRFPLGLSPR